MVDTATAQVSAAPEAGSSEVVQAGERRSTRLESVRGASAVAILVVHVYAYAHGWEPVIYQGFLHRTIMGLGFCVQLFFGLSGYLLYRAFAVRDYAGGRVDVASYARNRVLRVLPLYYVAVIVLLVVTQHGGSFGQWARFLTFTEEYSTKTAQTVDGPMWSLVIEVIFYTLLPLLAWGVASISRRRPERAIAVLLLLGAASVAVHQQHLTPTVIWAYSFPDTFYGIVPGMVLAIVDVVWRDRFAAWSHRPGFSSDLWVLVSVGLWVIICWNYSWGPLTAPATFLLLGAIVLPLRSKNLIRFLDWRPVALLGVASYSFYIWHVPIIQHLVPHAPKGTFGLLALALPASLAAAALSYNLIERPALRLRRRWADRAGQETTAARHGADSTAATSRLPIVSPRTAGALILGVAFLARVAAIGATHPLALRGDAIDYNRLGRLLASGGGFGPALLSPSGGPTAFRAPLYPLFLGAVYKVTGDSITAARLLQALLGCAVVALMGWIAARLWGRRAGWITAAIAAVMPALIIWSTALMTESIYLPLELVSIAAALKARGASGRSVWGWWAVAGIGAGLGVLDRPVGFVLVGGLAILALTGRSWGSLSARIKGASVMVLVSVLVLVPWEVRNYSDFHRLIPVSTIDGFNLAGTYNAQAASDAFPLTYAWRAPSAVPSLQPLFQDRSLNEATLNDELANSGYRWIEHHPSALPGAMFWNTFRTFELSGMKTAGGVTDDGFGRHVALLEMVSFWLVAGLALIGLFGKRLWRAPPALWVIPVLFLLSSVPVLGMSRIRAPIDPFLVFAAGLGVLALADRFLGAHNRLARSRGEPAEPTAALVPSVSAEVLAPAEPLA